MPAGPPRSSAVTSTASPVVHRRLYGRQMRVLICPDKFAGTLSAPEVAEAIAAGWRAEAPGDTLRCLPLADGGPGLLDALSVALDGSRITVETCDPLGRPVDGEILRVGDTAYLESAQACGLQLLSENERDPLRTTSFGLGRLITAAIESGATTVVVGLGGSATNDGGAGMLTALGVTPLDAAGRALPYGGGALTACAGVTGMPRLRQVSLIAATDVDNPLCGIYGASAIFGPQKGAGDNDVQVLDHALAQYAAALIAGLPGCPPELAQLPGAGAAGGIGAALFAIGARRESGAGLVSRAVGLDAALDDCDLVITGEGSFDHQSLRGKLVSGVAQAAAERGVPCTVMAGQVAVARREAAVAGIDRTYSLAEWFGSVARAMEEPAEGLRGLGAKLARRYAAARN
jgi:glycerate kinase